VGLKNHKLNSGITIGESFEGRQVDKVAYAKVLAERNNTEFLTEYKNLHGFSVRKEYDPDAKDNAFYITRRGEKFEEGNVLYVTTPPPSSVIN